MIKRSLIILLSVFVCDGVIYHLNESEYARMPPVYHLDAHAPCQLYCYVDLRLTADGTSELLNMIQEYSAQTTTHYNHSKLQYGICVTHTCNYQEEYTTVGRREILEECLNNTIATKYALKAKITDITCNDKKFHERVKMDIVDVIVAVICVCLLVLNILGSLQEFWLEKSRPGSKLLSCFSVQRNLKKLFGPAESYGKQLTGLRGLNAIRHFSMTMVIFCHAMLPFCIIAQDTQHFEELYAGFKYVASGTLIVQVFFVLSGFLLAHNAEVESENNHNSISHLLRKILLRWLRLTPVYVIVLAITATGPRFYSSGPLWQLSFGKAVQDCRRDWWLVLLYVINYTDGSHCLPESWYLAADMQLTIVGLTVCMLMKGRTRTIALTLLFTTGVLASAAHTYIQDLDYTLMLSPEVARGFFVQDATFNQVYKRGHTNLPSYVLGMAAGLLTYHWQKTSFDLRKYMIFRYIFWAAFPAGHGVVALGSMFYADNARAPIYARVLWATCAKPAFGTLVAILVVGLAMKVDSVYRGLFSKRVFVTPARLSYCAYLLHMLLLRSFVARRSELLQISSGNVVATLVVAVAAAQLAAAPMFLLLEAPVANVVKTYQRGTSVENATSKDRTYVDNDGAGRTAV